MKSEPFDTDEINLNGATLRIDWFDDHDSGMPWDEHDGHGEIREVNRNWGSRIAKNPGERVMHDGNGFALLYDWQATMLLAKKDGWGLGEDGKASLARRLGKPVDALTTGEVCAESVQRDFDYCRKFASGELTWCGYNATLTTDDGEELWEDSLWGIESDSTYREELIAVIRKTAESELQSHIESLTREESESFAMACRGVATV